MIRDITIGQYYPAESVIHRLDPQSEAGRNTDLYHFSVFAPFLSDVSGGSCFPDHCDQGFQSAFPLYDKRFKGDHGTTSDHRGFQYVPHAGNAAYQDLEADPYGGRCKTGRFYGDPAGISDRGLFRDDTDHHTESSDGWYGKRSGDTEQAPCTGP